MDPISWQGGRLILLDQRRLPNSIEYLSCETSQEVFEAIRSMVVRGAPAIGVAAAYGMVLVAKEAAEKPPATRKEYIFSRAEFLKGARPTAINLKWALDSMIRIVESTDWVEITHKLERTAVTIHADDLEANSEMGRLGATLIDVGSGVLTHCNAGALATAGYGTALGVIRSAYKKGLVEKVYATETRPWLQGSRLTATELQWDGIGVTLIADSAAGFLFRSGRIDWVIVGADRVAVNGDVANKIGTYSLAVLAKYHQVRFMVVAPTSTIDAKVFEGSNIPIEYRSGEEITKFGEKWLAPPKTEAFNPVFDVTPAELIDVIVTEKGVILNPQEGKIQSLISK